MKRFIFVCITLLLVTTCTRRNVIDEPLDGFVKVLSENKEKISLYIVDDEATAEFYSIFPRFEENEDASPQLFFYN